jgi:hypothetical protein
MASLKLTLTTKVMQIYLVVLTLVPSRLMRGAYAWDVEDQVFFSKLTLYNKNCDLNTNICPDFQC